MVYNFQKVPPVVGTLVGAIRWGPFKLLNFQVLIQIFLKITKFAVFLNCTYRTVLLAHPSPSQDHLSCTISIETHMRRITLLTKYPPG